MSSFLSVLLAVILRLEENKKVDLEARKIKLKWMRERLLTVPIACYFYSLIIWVLLDRFLCGGKLCFISAQLRMKFECRGTWNKHWSHMYRNTQIQNKFSWITQMLVLREDVTTHRVHWVWNGDFNQLAIIGVILEFTFFMLRLLSVLKQLCCVTHRFTFTETLVRTLYNNVPYNLCNKIV